MHGLIRRAAVAAGSAVVLLGSGVWAAGPTGAAGNPACPGAFSSTATSCTYHSTGAEQDFTVPSGVTAVTVHAVGAPGGAQITDFVGGGTVTTPGGAGADVTATVPLSAGTTTLYVEVGGAGSTAHSATCNSPSLAFNGGGSSDCAGGGGGASDVRTTSIATVPNSALTTANDSRLVVAGGGGGAGDCDTTTVGGTAGDSSATGPGNGGDANTCRGGSFSGPGGNGGFGGSAGGAGGAASPEGGCTGLSGSLGVGANQPTACITPTSGGGGGGYFGGGSGGQNGPEGTGGGGGAGSSFSVAGQANTSMSEDTTGTPLVTISWTPASWPPAVTGIHRPPAGAAEGYYLGVKGSTWSLIVTHPGTGKVVFTGTVTLNAGRFRNVALVSPESDDSAQVSGKTLTFRFADLGDIDGVRFATSLANTSITFTLNIGGQPATASQIFLGGTPTQASSGSPLTFTR